MEAADRFTDTSWQIHRQWQSDTNSAFPTAKSTSPNNNTPKEGIVSDETVSNGIKPSNTVPNGVIKCAEDDTNLRIRCNTPQRLEPESRKVIQIETVQTTCENTNRPAQIKTEAVLKEITKKIDKKWQSETNVALQPSYLDDPKNNELSKGSKPKNIASSETFLRTETRTLPSRMLENTEDHSSRKIQSYTLPKDKATSRKIVHIETIQTICEPAYHPAPPKPKPALQNTDHYMVTNWEVNRKWQSASNVAFPIPSAQPNNSILSKGSRPNSIATTETVSSTERRNTLPRRTVKDGQREVLQIETVQTRCDPIINRSQINSESVLVNPDYFSQPISQINRNWQSETNVVSPSPDLASSNNGAPFKACRPKSIASSESLSRIETHHTIPRGTSRYTKDNIRFKLSHNVPQNLDSETRKVVHSETVHTTHEPVNQYSQIKPETFLETSDHFLNKNWKIHRQWQSETNMTSPTADFCPSSDSMLRKENRPKSFASNETFLNREETCDAISKNQVARVECPEENRDLPVHINRLQTLAQDLQKIVQIETLRNSSRSIRHPGHTRTESTLHTHEANEPIRSGTGITKMLSSSHSSGYGEALTSQPRSTRGGAAGATGGMDLSYVTERIIALWFPSSTTHQSYKQGQRHAAHMLRNKHGDNYMIFNLSEPKRALRNEHKHVKEAGWPPKLAPPLERLCSVCKEIESWLSGDQHRIAVLHACGTKDKLGVVVAAYMHYSSICGTADQALDRFSMRRFLEDNIGPLQLPSNKRYIDYFAGLLSHNIKVNAAPLYLTHVTVLGAPSFQQGGCRAFLKLYEGLTPVYTSGVYSVVSGVKRFTVNIAAERRPGLQLRGDILIKCYHRGPADRETVFACQFHTCAVADYTLSFTRQELDGACNDSRFPPDGAVELHFSAGPEGRLSAPAPTPAVPVSLADDPVTRADSPLQLEESDEEEDSDAEDVNHTFGPLDGSIYATIAKKPELSPGAVSSPLTVSMDSGISSAGHQQNANTNASASPPPTAQPSPLTPEDQHRELDELLTDMMLTVQSIPDVKPRQQSPAATDNTFNLENVRFIDEEEDKNIPYHARQDSRPFSYGVNSSMIGDSKGLSSPSLVRKASFNKSSGDTLKKVQTQVFPDSFPSKTSTYSSPNYSNFNSSNYNSSSRYGTYSTTAPNYKKDPIDDIFTESALSANRQPYRREFREELYKDEIKRYDPMKRSLTDGSLRRSPEKITDYKTSSSLVTSPYSDSESLSPPGGFRSSPRSPEFHETYATNNLTWLQKQQLKLKERREMQLREERQPHETRLLSELRNIQSRHIRPSASHRADGYTSDTTAFADDDDDFTIPLHINTASRNATFNAPPSRSTSLNYSAKTYHTANERPFVGVKRAHEKFVQSSSSPASALAANPMGHVIRPPSRGADTTDSGLLSLVEQEQYIKQTTRHTNPLYREESWRTQSTSEIDSSPPQSVSPRPQTPAFPVHARTPYTNSSTPTVQFDLPSERLPPKSPTTQRKDRPTSPSDLINGTATEYIHATAQRSVSATPPHSSSYKENFAENYQGNRSPVQNGSASPTVYYGHSRRSSVHSESPQEVSPAHVKFVRDTSKYWYKAAISREEAISLLRNQAPGTFVVRDSNSFPGAFGLALKVATLPSNIQSKSPGSDEYVRHFLIEPTSRGVRLKGCVNEPVFSSLSALIYQHSVIQMALPCRLMLPEGDIKASEHVGNPAQILLSQGAACNVLYLFSVDMESLTGPQAVRKAVIEVFQKAPLPVATTVHFKVNGQGVTLTDHKRKLFFRRHYPINTISYCGLDPDEHRWSIPSDNPGISNVSNKIFGFVARKPASSADNQCHLFAELEPEQPATAIVNFVNKVLSSSGAKANIV